MTLPSKETLLKRVNERLNEYKAELAELKLGLKEDLEHALVWMEPLETAIGLRVYGDIRHALTNKKSKATVESLYDYYRDEMRVKSCAVTNYSTLPMSNIALQVELSLLGNMFDPMYGIFSPPAKTNGET